MSGRPRPRVTLKLATSLDGKIALADGSSQWITGAQSRAIVHQMRAAHDAILTGVGTILADDPALTARPEGGCEKQPDVIVMDSQGRTPMGARVFSEGSRQVVLRAGGNLEAAIADYSTVMIEAGAKIAASALAAGLIDRIEWFRAPKILGGEGIPVVAGLGLETLAAAPTFKRVGLVERGEDIQETYERIR
jgi:diaminohydroxyphosphoribosylaminopyrimidine deaminase/5-amino-6-(5-phosphoribosylamino)uracil reductase